MEHSLRPSQLGQAGASSADGRQIFTALRLMISAAERRYDTRVETVYILGKAPRNASLQQLLGRPIEAVALSDVLAGDVDGAGLSALGAVYAADEPPSPALSNFRTREFGFSPRIGEFMRGLFPGFRHAAHAALAVAAAVAIMYGAREYRISATRDALAKQIQTVIPDFDPASSNILEELSKSERKISDDLGVLGSPARIAPLDALLEIVQRIPASSDLTVSSLRVSSRAAELKGNAPDYSAIERLQKELRGNRSAFGDVKLRSTSPTSKGVNFELQFDLRQ